jgi:hypothetical protein
MRTIQQINEEYSLLCAELGHHVWLAEDDIPMKICNIKAKIVKLNAEILAVKQEELSKEKLDVQSPVQEKNV